MLYYGIISPPLKAKRRGRVVWPSAHAWNVCNLQGFAGSNPALSARITRTRKSCPCDLILIIHVILWAISPKYEETNPSIPYSFFRHTRRCAGFFKRSLWSCCDNSSGSHSHTNRGCPRHKPGNWLNKWNSDPGIYHYPDHNYSYFVELAFLGEGKPKKSQI